MPFPPLRRILLLTFTLAACTANQEPLPRSPDFIPVPPRAVDPSAPNVIEASPTAAAMTSGIRSIWAAFPDRAGVAVIRDKAEWVIEHRGNELMPQQSVSKLWVALALLDVVDRGRLRLSDPVTVMPGDLTVFSRAMNAKVGNIGWTTTLGELLDLALTKSDNTANDVLLRAVGGPDVVRSVIAAKGLGAIRFGAGEHLLQSGTAGLVWREEYRRGQGFQAARAQLAEGVRSQAMDAYVSNPPDGAAPVAIARALIRLGRGELLSPASTRHMLGLMADSETGRLRLRAGLAPGWNLAHKTGTGQDYRGRTAGYNDVGLITAPDGTRYAIVIQIAETTRPLAERQQLMQGVVATVVANHLP